MVDKSSKRLFFSIVIPAHNEENYIGRTLGYLKQLNYPKDKFEVIVAENGSDDNTLKVANKFKSNQIEVYSIKERGISKAKNFGASKSSRKSEWLVFLDADVLMDKECLSEINEYIQKNDKKNLTIGTVSVLALEKGIINYLWFWYWDKVHKFMKLSASIQVVSKKYFKKVWYDEKLKMLEDSKLIEDMRGFGNFFYVSSAKVKASTRRFKKVGGIRLALKWTYAGTFLSYKKRINQDYGVVR